jgi:AcrR family transcriptional regulator
MGDPQKTALLTALVDYILEHGLADLSLRPAAVAIGTSPRMLLYYFNSKEELLTAAIAQARAREIEMFAREVQKWGETSPAHIFRRVWNWYSSERRAPYQRFFFEVYGLALQSPTKFPEFLRTVGSDFLSFTEQGLIARGFRRHDARALATLSMASIRGLLMDLMTTGDRARVDAAARLAEAHLAEALLGPMAGQRSKGARARRVRRSPRRARRR